MSPVTHELPQVQSAPLADEGNAVEPGYWRSLEQLEDAPEFREFMEREFPPGAEDSPTGVSRRRWLQIMGASIALAGASAGCRRWEKEIMAPFVEEPTGRVPGIPQKFASMTDVGGFARGIIVTSYDGRPIQVAGNPLHPAVGTDSSIKATRKFLAERKGRQIPGGACDVWTQASTLTFWDPDRAVEDKDHPLTNGVGEPENASWNDFADWVAAESGKWGDGVRFLSEATSSLSVARLKKEVATKFAGAKWHEFESVSFENFALGCEEAFGKTLRPVVDLTGADVLLTLDCDLFFEHPQRLTATRQWADRRDPKAKAGMNRLYVAESQFTSTGSMADHRVATKAGDIEALLSEIEKALKVYLADPDADPATKTKADRRSKFVNAVASDLAKKAGRSLVVAGHRQPPAVHARVCRINAVLKNAGKTVRYVPAEKRDPHVDSLKQLVADLNGGKVKALFILGGNPVYDSPADIDFAAAMKKAGVVVRLGDYPQDETSQAAGWRLPKAHELESWSDGRSWDGTLTVGQPIIEPLYQGKSIAELLSLLLDPKKFVADGEARAKAEEKRKQANLVVPKAKTTNPVPAEPMSDGYQILKKTLLGELGASGFSARFSKAIHDGFVANSAPKPVGDAPKSVEIGQDANATSGFEVVFALSEAVYDGRYANNAWLQGLPGRMTKLVWSNAAVVGFKTAEKLGVKLGDHLKVEVAGKSLTLPVYVLPGQAEESIGIALGYGRMSAGTVGGYRWGGPLDGGKPQPITIKELGFNAGTIRPSGSFHFGNGNVAKVSGNTDLATTQDHYAIDTTGLKEIATRVANLVREGTFDEYKKHPDFAKHMVHHPALKSLWEEYKYDGTKWGDKPIPKWGMSIDLNKCVGCNACVVACQSENNIPVVDAKQVRAGRGMHWIRVDRYFAGEPEEAQVVAQPVTCVHCENAPCEQVCPVAATIHDHQGLNVMVYNRCVGTRYCANNCPYKVRRFNYLHYNEIYSQEDRKLATLGLNPEVTVRGRGVMEKCTYCQQRINKVSIDAKNHGRAVADGEVRTACQESCPADAIQFGNLLDEKSAVRKAQSDDRAYAMLSELNVKPRTQYLARIRNPHPLLADDFKRIERKHEDHKDH